MELDNDGFIEQQGDAVIRITAWRLYLIHEKGWPGPLLTSYLTEVLAAERKKASEDRRG